MAIRGGKKKIIQVGKGEVISSLFADDILLYTESPKDAIRKLLDLINELGKITGYTNNAQKYLAFLYTYNQRAGREIKETISFTIATKRIKYIGMNLPKETCLLTYLNT